MVDEARVFAHGGIAAPADEIGRVVLGHMLVMLLVVLMEYNNDGVDRLQSDSFPRAAYDSCILYTSSNTSCGPPTGPFHHISRRTVSSTPGTGIFRSDD